MIYDLKTPIGIHQFNARSQYLLGKKSKVDLTEKRSKRTINQNSYIHLIIDYWATQVGYSSREAKDYFKDINPEIFEYKRNGHTFNRGTSDLDVLQMGTFIDNVIKFSDEQCGIALPLAHDQAFIDECNNEIERQSEHLKRKY